MLRTHIFLGIILYRRRLLLDYAIEPYRSAARTRMRGLKICK